MHRDPRRRAAPLRDSAGPDSRAGRQWLLILAGVLVIIALGGLTLWNLRSARTASAPAGTPLQVPLGAAETALPPLVQSALPTGEPALLPEPLATDGLAGLALPGQAATAPLPAPAPQAVLAAPADTAPLPAESLLEAKPEPRPRHRNNSPALVFDAGAEGDAATDAGAEEAGGAATDFAPPPARVPQATRSTPLASSARHGTVTRGTLIPAVLETAIDAQRPGRVRAVVSTDVRSADGRRVLVPRSSRLIGEYRARAGDKRAYVVWTQLARPGGGTLRLAAPPAGQFFEGFGRSGLQSIIGAPAGGAAARVRPGEPIRIYTGKDVDLGESR